MGRADGPPGLLATVEFLGFVVAAAWIMQMLPADMSTALTAWMLTSIPISIVIGHCALGEDKPCRGG